MNGYQRRLVREYLMAAALSALLMPVLVVGFGAPAPAGFAAALLLFCALALFSAVRKAPGDGRITTGRIANPALAAAFAEAEPALARIADVVAHIPKNAARDRLASIAEAGRGLIAEVAAEPTKLAAVQRALTYYLPRTADIAEAYAQARAREVPDPARIAAIEEVVAKLEHAMGHFGAQLEEEDLRALDTELKLIRDALAEDVPRGG